MLFTYGKGGTLQTSTYPINSRPPTNNDPNLSEFRGPGSGKPNPLKQWRKQLKPYYPSHSTQISIDQIDNPSVSILTDSQPDHTIYYELLSTNHCIGINTENGCKGGSHNIRRSGSTINNPKYSSSTRQYLQKRCKTFEQNQSHCRKVNSNSTSNFISTRCFSNCNYVTYKPNNATFKTQGAVTAEGYTSKVKNDVMNNQVCCYNSTTKKYSILKNCSKCNTKII